MGVTADQKLKFLLFFLGVGVGGGRGRRAQFLFPCIRSHCYWVRVDPDVTAFTIPLFRIRNHKDPKLCQIQIMKAIVVAPKINVERNKNNVVVV
jgi:hypothetical protein